MKLIYARGLPASGKSTWAKEVAENPDNNTVRVCRDDIRNMLGKYWLPKRENLVTAIENGAVQDAILEGYNVIVDATNFKNDRWEIFSKSLVFEYPWLVGKIEVEMKDFTNVPLNVCIERDAERTIGKVGEDVIRKFYNKNIKK